MIASVRKPADWNKADWGVAVTILTLFATGVWQAASANYKLQSLLESESKTSIVVQDHEKRITKLEYKR